MSKRGSLGYQMQEILKAVFRPGGSRHVDKREARGLIRGTRTMRCMVADVFVFGRYVRERWPEVRRVEQVTPEMAQGYIVELVRRERSGGYIGRVCASLRKLDAACRYVGVLAKDAPALLPLTVKGYHSDTRTMAYTPQEAEMIINYVEAVDPQGGCVLRVMLVTGLRVSEAIYLRDRDIDVWHCVVRLEENANHTKGGRPRVVRVTEGDRDWLAKFRERGEQSVTGHLFAGRGSLADRVRRRVRAACDALGIVCLGTHGMRKTFAAAEYVRAVQAGADDQDALLRTSRQLGHNRACVAAQSYVDADLRV